MPDGSIREPNQIGHVRARKLRAVQISRLEEHDLDEHDQDHEPCSRVILGCGMPPLSIPCRAGMDRRSRPIHWSWLGRFHRGELPPGSPGVLTGRRRTELARLPGFRDMYRAGLVWEHFDLCNLRNVRTLGEFRGCPISSGNVSAAPHLHRRDISPGQVQEPHLPLAVSFIPPWRAIVRKVLMTHDSDCWLRL